MRLHVLFALIVACAGSAQASIVWNWSFSDGGGVASGTFTTAGSIPTANTPYTITGITGSFNGSAITGLVTYSGDDQTFEWDGTASSKLLLDVGGISFSTAANNYNVNAGQVIHYDMAVNAHSDSGRLDVFASSVAVAPEPSTITFLGAGLAALFAIKRKVNANLQK